MIIRQLNIADLEKFFNLRLISVKDEPTSFLNSYDDELKAGPAYYERALQDHNLKNIIVGAYVEDKLVGMVGIYQLMHKRLSHRSHLWGTYVIPNMRKSGIAKQLVEFAISHAKNHMQCKAINLTVGASNLAAQNLYRSCGFVRWGVEPMSLIIDGVVYDEDHMTLLLS